MALADRNKKTRPATRTQKSHNVKRGSVKKIVVLRPKVRTTNK